MTNEPEDTTDEVKTILEDAGYAVAEMEAVEPDPTFWEKQADREAAERVKAHRAVFDALFPDTGGNLEAHARRELELAGLFSEDSDYGGMLGNAVLDLVRVFAHEEHSGFSAGMTVDIFRRVAMFKTLTPITNDPAEWTEFIDGKWQNLRQSSCFSEDGGKTYYDIDANDGRAIKEAATRTAWR